MYKRLHELDCILHNITFPGKIRANIIKSTSNQLVKEKEAYRKIGVGAVNGAMTIKNTYFFTVIKTQKNIMFGRANLTVYPVISESKRGN